MTPALPSPAGKARDLRPSEAGRRGASPLRRALLLGAVGVVAMGLAGFREHVVQAAPQMAGLYGALGLRVNLTGLDFVRVGARIVQDGGRKVLIVEGDIANVTASAKSIPTVRLALRGADDHTIYAWTVKPPKPLLNQGEKAGFSARLAAPPADIVEAVVDFDVQPASPKRGKTG